MRPRTDPRPLRLVALGLVAACACVAAACGPSDPLDVTVSAKDSVDLAISRSQAEGRLSTQQLADFDRAVQEIKFHIMATETASGASDVAEAALGMINGKTFRVVIQTGLRWELDRAEFERSTLEKAMFSNAQMTTRPGDADSAEYLSDYRDRQTKRLEAAKEEVWHTRDRLAAAGAVFDIPDSSVVRPR
jgi:hypothetical protein